MLIFFRFCRLIDCLFVTQIKARANAELSATIDVLRCWDFRSRWVNCKDQQWGGGRSSNSIIKLKVKSLKGNFKELAKVNSVYKYQQRQRYYFMRAMGFHRPNLCINIASETVCPFISIMKTYDMH